MDQLAARIAQPPMITNILSALILIGIVHYILRSLDYLPDLFPLDHLFLWNVLVFLVPLRLVVDAAKCEELRDTSYRPKHAAKSEALRQMFGMRVSQLPGADTVMRRVRSLSLSQPSFIGGITPVSDAPAGLGNVSNSCYQNSVLQSLAALHALPGFLHDGGKDSTTNALSELLQKLSTTEANGRQLWTPSKLKSMNSWQQQDAQEYFSKIVEELDKEATKSLTLDSSRVEGLAGLLEERKDPDEASPLSAVSRNPIEGLLAQRVICTSCGFSEGLSMIPFNCLTVPLGSASYYTLEDCLDESTKLESIEDVTCAKCTLLRAETQIERILTPAPASPPLSPISPSSPPSSLLSLPLDIRVSAVRRLAAIKEALDTDDFADKTLTESCQISKRAHVSSTKTRQAVIARAPKCLVVHVNRSVFDEITGEQRKNYARVRFSVELNLRKWMLDNERQGKDAAAHTSEGGGPDPTEEQLAKDGASYQLRAVIEHYGRHDNGHYICYRQHGLAAEHTSVSVDDVEVESEAEQQQDAKREQWWRLSDEDVDPVSEETVLGVGGVFMLFYERISEQARGPEPHSRSAEISDRAAQTEEAEEHDCPAVTSLEVDDKTEPFNSDLARTAPKPDAPPEVQREFEPSLPPATMSKSRVDLPSPLGDPTPSDTLESSLLPPSPSRASQLTTTEPIAMHPSIQQLSSTKPTTPPLLMRTSRGRQASAGSDGSNFAFGTGVRAMGFT